MGLSRLEGVEHQWGQGKVVDHLGFVGAIAEVGDVVSVGDVGFGDEGDLGRHDVEQGTHQLDDTVGLGAGGCYLFRLLST